MPVQRTLFDDAKTIQERFEDFLADHADVYREFKRIAIELRTAGVMHYGSKAIVEIVRYHRFTSSQGQLDFKINNDFTSRLARMLVDECPEFEGWFEFRKLKAE